MVKKIVQKGALSALSNNHHDRRQLLQLELMQEAKISEERLFKLVGIKINQNFQVLHTRLRGLCKCLKF